MASHTPQESQSLEQQEPQPPEQLGIQDSAPADPSISSIPGLLKQNAAHIPAAVLRAAQAAGLGRPIRAYTRKQPSRRQLIIALLENVDIWLGTLGLWILGGMLIILLHAWLPLNLIIVGMLSLALQPLALLILQARVAAHRRRRLNSFRAWSCAGGLVYRQEKHYHAVRWEQIEVVIRKIISLNDVHATSGFLVLPNGAPPFEFALLQGPYAEHLQSLGKKRPFTLAASNAEQSIRVGEDGSMEVSAKIDLSAYAGLGELIEAQMISQHWPRVLVAYHSGASIAFGPLVINQQGLRNGNERLTLDKLAGVKIAKGNLRIMKKPRNRLWAELPVLTIPNLALLLTLLHRVRSGEIEALVR